MRYLFSLFFFLIISQLGAQSTDIPLNSPAYQIFDRWDAQGEAALFTTVKPISRRYFADGLTSTINQKSSKITAEIDFIRLETSDYQDSLPLKAKPLFGRFFKNPADLFSVSSEDFDLHVNPIVVLGAAREEGRDLLFENYRGLEIRGTIDNKVSFYTMLTENQARYAGYVQAVTDSTLGVPYEGFWKQYQNTGVDFLRAQAYIDVNVTDHIGAQFGYGKHFIGDGRRSLILSDFGNNYPYLRLNTRVWKIQYTNIFAQLIGETQGGTFGLRGTGAFTKKQLATHHLSIQASKNLTIGLFESVIYGDSTGQTKIGYFNPLMFYRALEQQDGSSDNVLLGLDAKWNLWNRVSLYGQLVIDELIVGEVFSNSGWWGNKQGFQVGAKYFDALGISSLNVQAELNKVRPYVYGHETNFSSYSHYNQALAHPLGANFREVLLAANYQPLPKLTIFSDVLLAKYGNDTNGLSYGRDILETYLPSNRPGDYGNDMFQGVTTDLLMIQVRASYAVMHNMVIDVNFTHRAENDSNSDIQTNIFGMTYRWNFPYRSYLF
ncbi:MAG: hypothetical protein JXR10_02940 [Cyclobacteriaceae bacterium]